MKITVRHPIAAAIPMNSKARITSKPGGIPSEAIAQQKYPNARATLPITDMMLRPAVVFHHGAKSRYSKEKATVTAVAA